MKKSAEEKAGQSHESAHKETYVQSTWLMNGGDSESKEGKETEEEWKGPFVVAKIC